MPSESDLITVRLARIKVLIAELEKECAAHVSNHEKFAKLKAELDAAREGLKTFQTHDDSSAQ